MLFHSVYILYILLFNCLLVYPMDLTEKRRLKLVSYIISLPI